MGYRYEVGRIYKINVGVALLYFVIVLATTILTMIMGVANQNNMALRIILCTCFSILMIFISFENYKDGKSIFDKTIESKIIKMCYYFYYIFLALSTMFYIYESIAQYKANGHILWWQRQQLCQMSLIGLFIKKILIIAKWYDEVKQY